MTQPNNCDRIRKAADLLVNKISHDVGTPLGSILIWLEVLKHDKLDDKEKARAIAGIEEGAVLLREFFKELSDLSLMIAGTLRLQSRPIPLAAVIESAVQAAGPSAQAKSVQVSKVVDRKLGPVSGDENHLELLLQALLSNAIAFTPPDGRVTIALTQSESYAHITVSDDGPSLDGDLKDPLELLPPSSKRGRDVRLYLAHLLALLHGGSVDARTEGAGNSFTVRMPLLDRQELE